VAFLLALPVVVLVGYLLRPDTRGTLQGQGKISPMLDVEERTRLTSYKRSCQEDSDCEAPLGCVADGRVGSLYCTDSQCVADTQCPEGLVCRSVATLGDGPLVRLCIPVGPRKAGERCDHTPVRQNEACGPGLVCGGKNGWCGQPCRPDEVASCPQGFFCAAVAPEPLCLPTCEAQGCPSGAHCIRYEEGVSVCAEVYGLNCQQAPCPAGRSCQILDGVTVPGKIWMDCTQTCGGGRPECPQGQICSVGICSRTCDPQRPGECGEGFRCQQFKPGRHWECAPDW
jgi:hypothetical protein